MLRASTFYFTLGIAAISLAGSKTASASALMDQILCQTGMETKVAPAYDPTTGFGALRKDFVHSPICDIEIRSTGVNNECNVGTCHFEAWIDAYESEALRRTGHRARISDDYLSAIFWMDLSIQTLRSPDYAVTSTFAASIGQSRALMKKYGVRPPSAWKGGSAFKQGQVPYNVSEYLKNFTARVKGVSESITDPAEKEAFFVEAETQIKKIFTDLVGEIDSKFTYPR